MGDKISLSSSYELMEECISQTILSPPIMCSQGPIYSVCRLSNPLLYKPILIFYYKTFIHIGRVAISKFGDFKEMFQLFENWILGR
jgi:hypothetical protein